MHCAGSNFAMPRLPKIDTELATHIEVIIEGVVDDLGVLHSDIRSNQDGNDLLECLRSV
jgi:hypothetical protein